MTPDDDRRLRKRTLHDDKTDCPFAKTILCQKPTWDLKKLKIEKYAMNLIFWT